MIQVRFDEASRSRLVLVWEDALPPNPQEVDANAANLLFSIIGRGQEPITADAPAAPRRAKSATPRRRKPRAAKPKHH
jgi:hypothetical protein